MEHIRWDGGHIARFHHAGLTGNGKFQPTGNKNRYLLVNVLMHWRNRAALDLPVGGCHRLGMNEFAKEARREFPGLQLIEGSEWHLFLI